MMKNTFGNNPVSGSNFHGRRRFVHLLVNTLTSGNSFLLLGMRRIGKSSVLAEVVRLIQLDSPKCHVIMMNCQAHRSIGDFYKELHRSLPKSLQHKFRDYLKNSKKLPIKIIDAITDHIEEVSIPVLGSIKLRNELIAYANPLRAEITQFFKAQDARVILCIDELPFLFETIQTAREENYTLEIVSVLTTLRDWRNEGISMAICGSLNLHLQLEELGVSRKLLAGLITQSLKPYTRADAISLIEALEETFEIGLDDDLIGAMLDDLPDYIPQFIQYFYHIIKSHEGQLSKDIIHDSYRNDVYPHLLSDFIYQFVERLTIFSNTEYTKIQEILNYILENGPVSQHEIISNVEGDDVFKLIFKLMQFEFVEQDSESNISFTLNLIKEWWQNTNPR